MKSFETEMKQMYSFGDGDGSGEQAPNDQHITTASPVQRAAIPPLPLQAGQLDSVIENDSGAFTRDHDDTYRYSPRAAFDSVAPLNQEFDSLHPNLMREAAEDEARNQISRHADANNLDAPRKSKREKIHIIKEVLGMNHASTKGKTEQEIAQLELDRRWRNALAEEERLTELERQISTRETITASTAPEPNFPPKFLFIRPLIYHNIKTVPEHRQRLVKIAFANWIFVCFLLTVNAIAAITVIEFQKKSNKSNKEDVNKVMNNVLAVVGLVGIPLSFLLWYWRIYQACSTGSPGEHVVALCGLLIALAHALFAFSGPLNYGVCGIGLALWLREMKSSIVAIFVIVILLLWLLEAVIISYLLGNMFIYYRRDLRARREARRMMPAVIG